MSRSPSVFFGIVCMLAVNFAVSQTESDRAVSVLQSGYQAWGLALEDVESIRVSSFHFSEKSNLHYVYLQQQSSSIDIENAVFNFVFDQKGNLVTYQNRFVSNLSDKIQSVESAISVEQALAVIATDLSVDLGDVSQGTARSASVRDFYRAPNLSRKGISIQKKYQWHQGLLQLCYAIQLDDAQSREIWNYSIDASNGNLLSKSSAKMKCHFGLLPHPPRHHDRALMYPPAALGDNSSYFVYPLTVESPAHGERVFVLDPADPQASRLGWHDVDGSAGPEYSDTRGNNVFAQDDFDADDRAGSRPDGGENLSFNFPISSSFPKQYIDASITNLFYWLNINHDIFHHYGFDEAAGNFQVINYSGQGHANDPVVADAQDGGSRNNATFFTNEDGFPARVEMYLWGPDATDVSLEVTGSISIPGILDAVESAFSSQNKLVRRGSISGKVVQSLDQPGSSLACSAAPISNGDDLKGNIALIDRGTCLFVEKVRNAQALGAIAVIMCNNVAGPPIPMGGNDNGITIPAVMISNSDCELFRQALLAGEDVHVTIDRKSSTEDLDASFDNLIITHEFGHGITLRLTGGSGNVDCLNNQEQMGEGWSDYFGLMLTTDWNTAQPEDPRGIAGYLSGQGSQGRGIRNFPYSTSRRTNPSRYSDIRNFSIPHGVGSVWCSMLWDMTWAIIETDGISTDLYHGTAGNNIALQLVIEALKLQPCNPGFVDARDAILMADQLLYNGKHHFAIWRSFARRGLGAEASQGNINNVLDGQSDFSLPEEFRTEIDVFAARDSLSNIVLNWNSLREIDHRSFRILRSTDEITFSEIKEFAAGALKNTATSYHHADQEVITGQWYYYRLDQVNGLGVVRQMGYDSAFIVPFEKVLIFPNPSKEFFNLKISRDILGPIDIALVTLDGKTVWQQNDNASEYYSNKSVLVRDLPPGTYFVEIRTSDDEQITRRLVLY